LSLRVDPLPFSKTSVKSLEGMLTHKLTAVSFCLVFKINGILLDIYGFTLLVIVVIIVLNKCYRSNNNKNI